MTKELKYSELPVTHEVECCEDMLEIGMNGYMTINHLTYVDESDSYSKTERYLVSIDSEAAARLAVIFTEMARILPYHEAETIRKANAFRAVQAKKETAKTKPKATKKKPGPKASTKKKTAVGRPKKKKDGTTKKKPGPKPKKK